MTRLPSETVHQWYERTIIADTLAADQLESMLKAGVTYNHAARDTIRYRALDATTEMRVARAALIADRKTTTFGT